VKVKLSILNYSVPFVIFYLGNCVHLSHNPPVQSVVCCGYMKNVLSEFIVHTKKAIDVCYQGKKTKIDLDVGSGVRVLFVGQTFFRKKVV
jgi:hypothetical protein